LLRGGTRLPVADVVLGAALPVGPLGPEIITALVPGSWIRVLQRLSPVIGWYPRRLEIRAVPALSPRGRRRDERLQALRRAGIITHRDSIAGQWRTHRVTHLQLGRLDLGAAEDRVDV